MQPFGTIFDDFNFSGNGFIPVSNHTHAYKANEYKAVITYTRKHSFKLYITEAIYKDMQRFFLGANAVKNANVLINEATKELAVIAGNAYTISASPTSPMCSIKIDGKRGEAIASILRLTPGKRIECNYEFKPNGIILRPCYVD